MTSTPVTDIDIRAAVVAEYHELADVLEGLPAASWDRPSLCSGWRVREVVAHLTMPGRYTTARFLLEIARSRGDFHRMADRTARRDARLTIAEHLTALRSEKLHSWKPPGGGYEGALVHAVIHGLDVTAALGTGRRVPDDRMRLVLDGVTKPMSLRHFGVDVVDIACRADDLEWSFGSGAPLSGDAQDLALALCGRTLPAGRLQGAAASRFVQP